MDVLSYIISVIGLAGLIVSAIVTFVVYGVYSAFKLTFGVPWLEWLTLDEVVLMGHSRFWCEVWLPAFYRAGTMLPGATLHVRLKPDLSEAVSAYAAEQGFVKWTVQYYEFKFTSHGGGRRGKRQKFRVEILQPTPLYERRRRGENG